jgi:hypothetical protein
MNIVQIRSPFKIVINEGGQLFTQVKLYIWNKGDTEPTTPTYTFSKAVASLVNRECVYNISNQLQEFIEPISADNNNAIEEENPKCWCFFKVERFTGTDLKDLDLLDTTNYVGLNGFTDYMSGNQVIESQTFKFLNQLLNVDIIKNDDNGYFNLLVQSEIDPAFNLNVNYQQTTFTYIETLNNRGDEIILFKIPYVNTELIDPYKVAKIRFTYGEDTLFEIKINSIEECKYTPVQCDFQNSKGGWEALIFFKAQTNSISVKGSEFNLLPNDTDYDPLRGQSKVFNLNGNQSVKLNTGWVDENYNILIRDLLLSETVLIDNKPAMVKSKSQIYKTQLKDKMINYEIEFDYAFDLINNVL